MPRFFIDRPIFAWVLSFITMGIGILSILSLPIAQYPAIAPPTISVSANYPGASAQTVANTVTQVIEQQMTGLDGLKYFKSSSTAQGSASIELTFDTSIDPDIAQVQVQNKLAQATPLLPGPVQRQGVTVRKSSSGFLMVIALISGDGSLNQTDLSDYLSSNLADEVSRISGVGDVRVFGSKYAMRVWLDPSKMSAFGIAPSDVVAAISAENAQVSAGSFGSRPAPEGQMLNATITAQSLLTTPEDFESIVLRAETDGGMVLLRDVARVEIGSESYNTIARFVRQPAAGMAITLASGANALDTADAVRARMAEFEQFFPDGVTYTIPYDTTPFVKISIDEVVTTLIQAVILVFLTMFLFMQNFRATLIPTLAVPVVILGTFGILAAAGLTINTLTMLAMVLAIGLLVDDAIVVVENVQRIMEEEGLSPKEATRKSMDQITGALIGTTVVLMVVFIPMAFFGGSTGVIYRQFSITIVSAMVLSNLVALILTPALCATILRKKDVATEPRKGFFGWFNRGFDRFRGGYSWLVGKIIRFAAISGIVYLCILGAMGWMYAKTPTSFLPDEDQGLLFTLIQAPTGATAERTLDVLKQVEDHFLDNEAENVSSMFGVVGFSFGGSGQNTGIAFVRLKDWSERQGPGQSAQAIAGRAFGVFSQIQDARVFPIVPPSVRSLGNASGFDMYLQARGGQSNEDLLNARNQLLGMASQSDLIASVRPSGLEDAAQYNIDVDWQTAGAMGVTATDVANLLSIAWAGSYVNDFLDEGRVKRVFVQGEAESRAGPDDFAKWRVRNAAGDLVPLSNFASGEWTFGPQGLYRYNSIPAMQIQGSAAPGVSTGEALTEMERLVGELPPGFGLAWTGLSLEEKASDGQALFLYAISIAAVFLCLAALYESWAIPFAVLLAMPIGVFGALIAAQLGGYDNGIFFQVGLLTVVGLAGKNAILIVEFARELWRDGKSLLDATMEAASQRLRPIFITSIAFTLGVFPLALSTGAGAGARQAIGSGVVGGTLAATLIGPLLVPLFFYLIGKFTGRQEDETRAAAKA